MFLITIEKYDVTFRFYIAVSEMGKYQQKNDTEVLTSYPT